MISFHVKNNFKCRKEAKWVQKCYAETKLRTHKKHHMCDFEYNFIISFMWT